MLVVIILQRRIDYQQMNPLRVGHQQIRRFTGDPSRLVSRTVTPTGRPAVGEASDLAVRRIEGSPGGATYTKLYGMRRGVSAMPHLGQSAARFRS